MICHWRSSDQACIIQTKGLEIRARPLAQASVKTVEQVQVTVHLPSLASAVTLYYHDPEYAIQNRHNVLLSTLQSYYDLHCPQAKGLQCLPF